MGGPSKGGGGGGGGKGGAKNLERAGVVKGGTADFADKAQEAAESVTGAGRWGDNKVFLADAHAAYVKQHGAISADEFKARLVVANREGKVNLSRADMPEAMDRSRVNASEAQLNPGDRFHSGTAHFIKVKPKK